MLLGRRLGSRVDIELLKLVLMIHSEFVDNIISTIFGEISHGVCFEILYIWIAFDLTLLAC